MTLEEAIAHAEEVAKRNEDFVKNHKHLRELDFVKRCVACATEHRQLAEWLKELKELRKQPEIIYCKDCDNLKSDEHHHWCKSHGGFFNPEKDFCSRAERRGME